VKLTEGRQIVDAPPSWCQPLIIEPEVYLGRYPQGQRRVVYKRALVELFSDFHARGDGLVMKITQFEDEEQKNVVAVRESFRHRKCVLQRGRACLRV
jgi:hypothetical protein